MKKIFILIILSLVIGTSYGQSKKAKAAKAEAATTEAAAPVNSKEIQWMTMSEALQKSAKNPKKILIDFYTDWCGWCKRMDKATYENPNVIKEINQNFYAVKFNAEKENTITFKGKEYKLASQGTRSVHELAVAMLNGQMGYPTTTILNNNQELIQSIPGYIEAPEMTSILKYFGQDKYLTMPYDQYKTKN